ncbi:MAG: hypothetical protein ACI4EY_03370 [Lachnospiraceae bacterium]
MNHIAKELLLDCSTQDMFCFSLRCAECGEVWKSRPVRFSKSGVRPETEGKKVIFDTLYKREKEAALFYTVKQAEEIFSCCPICHRLVCDHCFLVCEDLDMCCACAKRLKEYGEPVMERKTSSEKKEDQK